jgi:choloylglycine hydrolase
MGAMGLPGDASSASRFVRAAFVKANAVAGSDRADAVGQFFHMMDAVAVPRGCIRLADGGLPHTVYTSCYDLLQGVCYYTTYENRSIRAVELRRCAPDGARLSVYSMAGGETVTVQN